MHCMMGLTIDHSLKPLLLVLGVSNVQEKLVISSRYHLQSLYKSVTATIKTPGVLMDCMILMNG